MFLKSCFQNYVPEGLYLIFEKMPKEQVWKKQKQTNKPAIMVPTFIEVRNISSLLSLALLLAQACLLNHFIVPKTIL